MRVFVRVVEAGSFTRAAAELNLSHGMASSIIKDLEARHGVELIRRTTRRMALTDEGRHFHESARRILDEVAALEEDLSADRQKVRGKLVVQAPSAFSRIVLGPAIGDFLVQHPALELSLLSLDRLPDMIAEGIDVLIYVGPLPDSSLIARSLGHFPIVTVASPDYLQRHGAPAEPGDLDRHTLLDILSATSGRSLDWRFRIGRKTVLRPVVSNLRFGNSETAIAAAVGGAGILQNISYALTDQVVTGRLRLLLRELKEPGPEMHIVTRKYTRVPARIRAFTSFIVNLVQERRLRDEAILRQR